MARTTASHLNTQTPFRSLVLIVSVLALAFVGLPKAMAASGTIVVNNASGSTTSEGGTTVTFDVSLSTQPEIGETITVSVDSSDTGEVTVSPTSLSFNDATWAATQQVTVTGVDDTFVDGDILSTVTASLSGATAGSTYSDGTLDVTNTDDDTAGFTVTETGGTTVTDEFGATDTFTVVLDAQPLTDVVFTVTSSDTGEVTVDQATLTFTSANWDTAQTVTATGVNDVAVDGDQSSTITISIDDASSNDAFDPLSDQTITATNTDTDAPDPVEPQPPFEDLSGLSDEAITSIELLVDLGVTSGTSETEFSPSNIVSRWEMALFISRTLAATDFGPTDGTATSFDDIGGLSPEILEAIDTLSAVGITNGVTDTKFDPYGSVTRWQMAIFLTRLLEASGVPLPDATGEVPFGDLTGYSGDALVAIEQLYRIGISTGTSTTTYSPGEALPRWQMAIFLARAIETINS